METRFPSHGPGVRGIVAGFMNRFLSPLGTVLHMNPSTQDRIHGRRPFVTFARIATLLVAVLVALAACTSSPATVLVSVESVTPTSGVPGTEIRLAGVFDLGGDGEPFRVTVCEDALLDPVAVDGEGVKRTPEEVQATARTRYVAIEGRVPAPSETAAGDAASCSLTVHTGGSTPRAVTATVTFERLPAPDTSAPGDVVVTPGDGSVVVAFTLAEPLGEEGAVAYTLDGGTTWTRASVLQDPLRIEIGELTNGTSYLVAVRVERGDVVGEPSPAVAFVPRTVPARPTNLTVTPSDRSLLVSFTLASDGGSPVTGFELSRDGATWQSLPGTPDDDRITLSGLLNDQAFTFRLRAVNAAGPGAASDEATGTPRGFVTRRYGTVSASINASLALGWPGADTSIAPTRLFGWGSNNGGRLGGGSAKASVTSTDEPLKMSDDFVAVASGAEHGLGINASGDLFSWGAGIDALGLGVSPGVTPTPTNVSLGVQVERVAASGAVSFALGADGRIYVAGRDAGGTGVLGAGTVTETDTFISISDAIFDASKGAHVTVQQAQGASFALALDETGRLWGWGDTTFLGLTASTADVPTKLTAASTGMAGFDAVRFVDVAAGFTHVLAVDDAGRLWSWGDDDQGLQVLGRTSGAEDTPTRLTNGNAVAGIEDVHFVGVAAANGVSVALDRFGRLWTWAALNDEYSLGRVRTPVDTIRVPTQLTSANATEGIESVYFVDLDGGVDQVLTSDRDGYVWVWGFDNAGIGFIGNGDDGVQVGEGSPKKLVLVQDN